MSESRRWSIFSGRNTTGRPRRRALLSGVIVLILAIAVLGVYSWFRSRTTIPEGPTESAPVVTTTGPADPAPSAEPVRQVPAPEVDSDAPYRSEHYRAGEIAIGGDLAVTASDSDPSPLAISSVHGEAFAASGKGGSKLVITWATNKPARSRLSYGKGVGQADAVVDETEYGTSHSVIIPDVTPASTYIYVISARDKWGGSAQSDPYAVYTGAKSVSLFEIIAGAVGDVFGWAVKK